MQESMRASCSRAAILGTCEGAVVQPATRENKKKNMHQVVVDLLQQVGNFLIRVLIPFSPIRHEKVHNGVIRPVIHHGVELHEVLKPQHFIVLRDRCQSLDWGNKLL